MSLTDRLLAQLKARGLNVVGAKAGDPEDRLYLIGPAEEKTPDVLAALKKFKGELLEKVRAEMGDRPAGE